MLKLGDFGPMSLVVGPNGRYFLHLYGSKWTTVRNNDISFCHVCLKIIFGR